VPEIELARKHGVAAVVENTPIKMNSDE